MLYSTDQIEFLGRTMEKYVLLAVIAFFAFIGWSVFSRKGRSRQFGGDFAWSSEPYVIDESSGGKQALIVHRVQPPDSTEPHKVGLELRFTSALAFSMIPLSLSAEQARKLAHDLEKAAIGRSQSSTNIEIE